MSKRQSIMSVKSFYNLKAMEKENFLMKKNLVLGQDLSNDQVKDFFCKTACALEMENTKVTPVIMKKRFGIEEKKYDIVLESPFQKILCFFDLISGINGFVKVDSFDIFKKNKSLAEARLRIKLIKGDLR